MPSIMVTTMSKFIFCHTLCDFNSWPFLLKNIFLCHEIQADTILDQQVNSPAANSPHHMKPFPQSSESQQDRSQLLSHQR